MRGLTTRPKHAPQDEKHHTRAIDRVNTRISPPPSLGRSARCVLLKGQDPKAVLAQIVMQHGIPEDQAHALVGLRAEPAAPVEKAAEPVKELAADRQQALSDLNGAR